MNPQTVPPIILLAAVGNALRGALTERLASEEVLHGYGVTSSAVQVLVSALADDPTQLAPDLPNDMLYFCAVLLATYEAGAQQAAFKAEDEDGDPMEATRLRLLGDALTAAVSKLQTLLHARLNPVVMP